MQAKVRSKYEVDYLDDSKKFIEEGCWVFKLSGIMLEKKEDDWHSYPSVQSSCKNIPDWNLAVTEDGKVIAWSEEVDNLFLFYLDADTKADSITEVICNYRYDNKAHIRLIPEGYRYVTQDETGSIKSVLLQMAVEISIEQPADNNNCATKYIGYFYSEDMGELLAFADELVRKLDLDANVLNKFDWQGSVCKPI